MNAENLFPLYITWYLSFVYQYAWSLPGDFIGRYTSLDRIPFIKLKQLTENLSNSKPRKDQNSLSKTHAYQLYTANS